jgi:hypothetical protein
MAKDDVKINADGTVTKLSFAQQVGACVGAKSGSEWIAVITSYFSFYIFMAGWMAIHLYCMVYLLPENMAGHARVFSENGVVVSAPRNSRFMVHGISLASNNIGDAPNFTLDSAPWDNEHLPLKGRTSACTTGEPCPASQQLRIANNHMLTQITRLAPIKIECVVQNYKNSSIKFLDFTDPVEKKRTFPESMSYKPVLEADYKENQSSPVVYDTYKKTHDNFTYAPSFSVTWKYPAALPHIAEYKLHVLSDEAEVVSVSVECDLHHDAKTRGTYLFDEPGDEFDLGVSGIVKASYTFDFDFKAV